MNIFIYFHVTVPFSCVHAFFLFCFVVYISKVKETQAKYFFVVQAPMPNGKMRQDHVDLMAKIGVYAQKCYTSIPNWTLHQESTFVFVYNSNHNAINVEYVAVLFF